MKVDNIVMLWYNQPNIFAIFLACRDGCAACEKAVAEERFYAAKI